MPDNLSIDLLITDSEAELVLSKNKTRLESWARDVEGLKPTIGTGLQKDFDQLIKKSDETYRSFQNIAKTRLDAGNIGGLTKEIVRASERSNVLRNDIKSIQNELKNPNRKSSISSLIDDLKGAERELDNLNRKLKTVAPPQATNRRTAAGANFAGGVADGLNIPIGAAAIGAIGGAIAADFGKESLNAAKEASNAQLRLQAATIESGLAYKFLTQQAKLFGEQTLQSDRAAQSSFAQVVSFANAAGRSDKLELFRQRLADLAAVKGINPERLGDISRQLVTLQDEATDLLLNANPSAFYDKFAASIGKTASSLTDAEKRAAVFDEIIKRGALYDGSAEKKVNAAASATDRLNQTYENLKASFGTAVAIPLLTTAISEAKILRDLLKLLIPNSENETLKNLFTPNSTVGDARAELTRKAFTKAEILREQDKAIREAIANPTANLKNFALKDFNLADNFFNPEQRQKAINAAVEAATVTVEAYKSAFTANFADNNLTVGLAQIAIREFEQVQNLFDNTTRRQIAEGNERTLKAAREREANKRRQDAQKQIAAILGDSPTAATIQTAQSRLSSFGLRQEDFDDFNKKLSSELKKTIEEGKNKVKELGKTYTDTFNNLFAAQNKSNPFALIFAEGKNELDKLRESLRGLAPELQTSAIALQNKLTSNALFSARLDNSLNALNLRAESDEFRNFKSNKPKFTDPRDESNVFRKFDPNQIDVNKFFADFIEAGLKQISAANGGSRQSFNLTGDGFQTQGFSQSQNDPFTRFHSNIFTDKDGKQFTNGFSQSDARNDVFNSFDRVENADGTFGGFQRRQKTFSDLTEREKSDFLSQTTDPDGKDFKIQDRLNRQILAVQNSNALNPEQSALADKKLIALTSGLNPNQLSDNQREIAAASREREAVRLENAEREAAADRKLQIQIQSQIAENGRKLLELAEKEGLAGVIRIINDSDGAARSSLSKTPTQDDTRRQTNGQTVTSTFFEQFNNR